MNFLSWFKLLILEQKLNFGAFGKYSRYRCWCLEQKAKTTAEKLRIAREVLNGPSVSLAESQHNVEYLRKVKANQEGEAAQAINGQLPQESRQPLEKKSTK